MVMMMAAIVLDWGVDVVSGIFIVAAGTVMVAVMVIVVVVVVSIVICPWSCPGGRGCVLRLLLLLLLLLRLKGHAGKK